MTIIPGNRLKMLLTAFIGLFTVGMLRGQNVYDRSKLADFYQKLDFDNAIRYLRSFTGPGTETVSYNNDLGYSLYSNEEYKEAKAYFKKTFVIQPEDPGANLYLALIYNNQGRRDSSLYHYNILIHVNPAQYRNWQKAAAIYYQLGNIDSAFLYYQQAYRLNNSSGSIVIALCNLYILRKQTDSADNLLNDFLIRDTLNEDVIARKMEISFKKSLYDTVIFWGGKLWRDSSQLNGPFINLAYSYLTKKQYALCLQLCEWLEAGNRSGQAILYCEALAYGKTGRYNESNTKLDLCIKMSIQDDAHTYLAAKADNFENLKNYRSAANYYDTAWYIFHQPFDLYFAGRIYDKYYHDPVKTNRYYTLFSRNKKSPNNPAEERAIAYIEDYLKNYRKKK